MWKLSTAQNYLVNKIICIKKLKTLQNNKQFRKERGKSKKITRPHKKITSPKNFD